MKNLILFASLLFSFSAFATENYQPIDNGRYVFSEMIYNNSFKTNLLTCDENVQILSGDTVNVKNQTSPSVVLVQKEKEFNGKESVTYFHGGIELKKVSSRQEGFLNSKKVETTYRYIFSHRGHQLSLVKVRYIISGVVLGFLDSNNAVECVYNRVN